MGSFSIKAEILLWPWLNATGKRLLPWISGGFKKSQMGSSQGVKKAPRKWDDRNQKWDGR
jgi:hypothetical protein